MPPERQSGSGAWGFASRDSDYDVSGWELRKALWLLRKSNPPRLEALNEPDDAAGEVEELNGFFRRYARAA